MDCPDCGARAVAFDVPEELRQYAPGGDGREARASSERGSDGGEYAAACSRCLAVSAADHGGGDLQTISEAFPPDDDAAAACALAFGKLDSLALNRDSIRALLEYAERGGADPLLLLDRLGTQGSVQAHFDVKRRRPQLEQLL